MRGGLRIMRQKYARQAIEQLVSDYIANGKELYSPLKQKKCKTYNEWYNSIVYHLDKPSANYFFFLLERPHYSNFSKKQLTENEFSYSETYKGWTGWKKYTIDETKKRVWLKIRDKSYVEKIKQSLKQFYKTNKGKKVRKKQASEAQISRNRFYKTATGKAVQLIARRKQSATMKRKILAGEFTPNIHNSLTHWNAVIDGKKFRSSWEAAFYACNRNLLYEKLRIPYSNKVYIADFFDSARQVVYEIKPKALFAAQQNKIQEVIRYCLMNDIKFVWVNEANIKKYIDLEYLKETHYNVYAKLIKGMEK